MSKIYAPFTPEQVVGLNAYQAAGLFHPFTCGNEAHRSGQIKGDDVLIAEADGWHCPTCGWGQNWAHDFMPGFLEHVTEWQKHTLPVKRFGGDHE